MCFHLTCCVRSCKPLDIQKLPFPGELTLVLVNPKFEAPTKAMRAALPKEIPMSSAVHNCSQGASLVIPSLNRLSTSHY